MGNYQYFNPPLHLGLTILIIITLNIPSSFSEMKDAHILQDSRHIILFEQFGFSAGGVVTVSITDVSWKSRRQQDSNIDPYSIGFILVRESSFWRINNESQFTQAQGFCPLSSHFVIPIFKFNELVGRSTFNGSATIDDPDEYSLFFTNCQPEVEVTMDVHTEMYNVVDETGKKDFLPVGQSPLPELYFVFFVVYSVFFVVWIGVCFRQRPTVDKIHIIMGALLLFKALKMICASEDTDHVKRTGMPHGWDVAFYFFSFFKGVTLFTVIVLIGTGWSFLKPYLQEREKKVLMVVMPMQVIENIAYVVIEETSPAEISWFTWNQIFLLVDIVCCCAVFFPIIWSIKSLREASKTDGKAARNLKKLTLFRHFYIVVVGYLYFTRIVVSALAAVLNYRYVWVSSALAECVSLLFYLFIYYNFQPIEKNPYLFVGDEEEAAAAQALEEDDSFEL